MTAFQATNKAPGVYIEEVNVPGPIPGVGTSTGAIVGAARNGPMNTPVRLSNWTQFVETFGDPAEGPFFPQHVIYAPYAVRGFFEEGGSDLWFVRVGTAQRSELALKDRSAGAGQNTLIVRAKKEGTEGDAITVEVQDDSIHQAVAVRATSTLQGAAAAGQADVPLQAGHGTRFRPGDIVRIAQAAAGGASEEGTIESIAGDTLTLTGPLGQAFAAGDAVRIADLAAGRKWIRVDKPDGFQVGSNVTITQQGGPAPHSDAVEEVDRDGGRIRLSDGVAANLTMDPADQAVNVNTAEFRLIVNGKTFDKLSLDPRHSNYYTTRIDSDDVDVVAPVQPNPTSPPANMPRVLASTHLAGGQKDKPAQVTPALFKGGIDALLAIDEVNLLCVPDATDNEVQLHMIGHCETLKDRFALLDPQPRLTPAAVQAQRDGVGSDNGYAAIYYPRIVVGGPSGRITVPPSGALAGLIARVDGERGVFKAPANAVLRTALDLERQVTADEQGILNTGHVNVIRMFRGRGRVVWGARTISTSTQWQYVNVRRFVTFVEESLVEGTQFVVFEPNTPALWEAVKRQVSEFLMRQWTAGALVGTTPEQAFRVRADLELNPPAQQALGILVFQVEIAPAAPAEFIVFRVIQQPGRPLVEE